VKIERDLMALLPPKEWVNFSHRLIHHGRRICVARNPKCDECVLNVACPKVGVKIKVVAVKRKSPTTVGR
jgi:endonuclease-3